MSMVESLTIVAAVVIANLYKYRGAGGRTLGAVGGSLL